MCILQAGESRGLIGHEWSLCRLAGPVRFWESIFCDKTRKEPRRLFRCPRPCRVAHVHLVETKLLCVAHRPPNRQFDILNSHFHSLKVVKEAPGIVALHRDPIQLDCLEHLLSEYHKKMNGGENFPGWGSACSNKSSADRQCSRGDHCNKRLGKQSSILKRFGAARPCL